MYGLRLISITFTYKNQCLTLPSGEIQNSNKLFYRDITKLKRVGTDIMLFLSLINSSVFPGKKSFPSQSLPRRGCSIIKERTLHFVIMDQYVYKKVIVYDYDIRK